MRPSEKIIKEYYDHLQPDMSYLKFREICITPFWHARRTMTKGEFEEIWLMHLGRFKVFRGKVITMMRTTQKRFDNSEIGEKKYKEYMKNLITFVQRNSTLFTDVKDKVKPWISLE